MLLKRKHLIVGAGPAGIAAALQFNIRKCSVIDIYKYFLKVTKYFRCIQGIPYRHREINHFFRATDNFGSSCHPSKVVSGVGIILLNGNRVFFANDVAISWQNLGKRIPVIGIECTTF